MAEIWHVVLEWCPKILNAHSKVRILFGFKDTGTRVLTGEASRGRHVGKLKEVYNN